jgi:comEA protein
MSLFSFTRQEQITILFLALALLIGSIVTLVKRRDPTFAPELHLEERVVREVNDTVATDEWNQEPEQCDTLSLGKVDVNRATAEELMKLPGIGPKMAHRIVSHRESRGAFQTTEDLKEVKGIGDKTLERLRPHIKIE